MVFIVPIIDKNGITTYCTLEDKYKWFFIGDYWEDVYNELKNLNNQKFPKDVSTYNISTGNVYVKSDGEILIYKPSRDKGLEMTLDYRTFPKKFIEWLLHKKPNDFELQSFYLKHTI